MACKALSLLLDAEGTDRSNARIGDEDVRCRSTDMRSGDRGEVLSQEAVFHAAPACWLSVLVVCQSHLPGPVEKVFQVGLSAGAWVGAMAVVKQGESGILGDLVVAEPVDLSEAARKRQPREDEFRQGDQVPRGVTAAAEP